MLDQNDPASARDKARAALGDKFMTSFNLPPFYVSQAQVSTSSNSRSMVFTLAPVAVSSAELQNTLSGAAASLRAVGADVSFDEASLSIAVPFESRAELIDKLAALANAVPDGAEWSLVRAVLSPHDVAWDEADRVLTHVTSYREEVDLSGACSAFTAQIDAAAKNLTPLGSAAASDDEAQLKRELLKYVQSGWQDALAQSSVTFQAGANETRVEPCAARAVAVSASTFLPLRVAAIVVVIEFVGIVVLIARWRRKVR